jgi:hypothetical protein
MSKNEPVSNENTEEPIFSATKYEEYHVGFMAVVDEDIEI